MKTTELNTRKAAEHLGRSVGGIKLAVSQKRLIGRLENPRYRVFTIEELDTFQEKWPKWKRTKKLF